MNVKTVDLWLRGVWDFWDTHGTRLTSVLSILYSAISAGAVYFTDMDGKSASALLAVGAFFGVITRARGQNNVDIKSGKTVDPTASTPPTP